VLVDDDFRRVPLGMSDLPHSPEKISIFDLEPLDEDDAVEVVDIVVFDPSIAVVALETVRRHRAESRGA
jgi:hypothetical protein